MDINIKYDVDDISVQIVEDVKRTIEKEVNLQIKQLSATFAEGAATLTSELIKLLDIKDNRQRERIQRAVTTNLDKWTKRGGLK